LIRDISAALALEWFGKLPLDRQIATLSPEYVCADAARGHDMLSVFALYADQRGFWMHGAHWTVIPGCEDRYDIQSPYGYGGPVADCDDATFLADAWRCYQRWCRERGAVVEFIRLHPHALWQNYPGVVVPDRQTVVIDLNVADLRGPYETRCRTAVRKAEKEGLAVREYPVGAIASLFAEFYREAMVRIGAAPFYHFPDAYFRALEAMRGIHLFVCERDGVWMSAGLFLSGGDCLEYHLSATTTEGRALSATNLLIDYAAESGKQTGHHWLYLGGGTDASASNPLLRFKEGFSPLRRLYSYGYAVHDAAFYRELQMGYPESSRVLFYR